VQITFTVDLEPKDVLAFIDIHFVPVRLDISREISCPIFYRVQQEGAANMQPLPHCSLRSLRHLCRAFNIGESSASVTFEKTRDWYEVSKWSNGPNVGMSSPMTSPARTSTSTLARSPKGFSLSPTLQNTSTLRFPGSVISRSSCSETVLPGCFRGLRETLSNTSLDSNALSNTSLDFKA